MYRLGYLVLGALIALAFLVVIGLLWLFVLIPVTTVPMCPYPDWVVKEKDAPLYACAHSAGPNSLLPWEYDSSATPVWRSPYDPTTWKWR